MDKVIVYDKAKYHFDGEFPSGLPFEQAAVHTGFYVAWLALHDLISEETRSEFPSELEGLRSRRAAPSCLYRANDAFFGDNIPNDIGNGFTQDYFDFEKGLFLKDYEDVLGGELSSLYHVEETWRNYDLIAARIDSRFGEWRRARQI